MAKTSHVHQLSQVSQVKISFFPSSLMSGNLALASIDMKCYQKWLKNGVKSEFYCPFLTPIFMINLHMLFIPEHNCTINSSNN